MPSRASVGDRGQGRRVAYFRPIIFDASGSEGRVSSAQKAAQSAQTRQRDIT
jgi:hypothetical protein